MMLMSYLTAISVKRSRYCGVNSASWRAACPGRERYTQDSNCVVSNSGNSTKSDLYSLAVSMKNSHCLAKSSKPAIVRI